MMAKAKFPTKAKIAAAIEVAAAARSFEKRGDGWFSIDLASNSGSGGKSREETLRQHNRLIGFDALARLGFDPDETHELDWHTWPADTAEEFVAAGLAEWAPILEARANADPFVTLINAMLGRKA